MPLPVVRSPLGLPLGGPGLLPGPPALPGCWPEAYIIQNCGSFSNVPTLLDTYTSGAWGGWRPPLVPNKFVSGGPPLDSLSSRDRSEVALHGRGRDGGAGPYFRTVSVHQCLSSLPGRKTRDRGATPCFKTASAYQGRSTLHGRRTRDRGAAPYFIPALASQNSSAPCRPRSRDRGASPYFSTAIQVRVWGLPLFQTTTPSIGSSPRRANDQGRGASPFVTALPGEPDVEAAGRCHYPGAVSTVAAGAGPYLRPGADSPLFHRLPIPVPSDRTRSPPHDVPVQNTRNSGLR